MTSLSLDYESFGVSDLRKVGLDVYSRHPETEILMAAYRLTGGSYQHVEVGPSRKIPAELKDALTDPHVEKWAFNAQFERVMTRRVLRIKTPTTGWRCSMVLAYMLSFTGGLDDVGRQMGLPTSKQKTADGKRLIKLFSVPQKPTKAQPKTRLYAADRPEDWKQFCEYNVQDVVAEEALRVQAMRYAKRHIRYDWEWHLYELDQRINDKGLPVDLEFSRNSLALAQRRQSEILAEMREITGLSNPNSVSVLLKWLRERGYPFDDLGKDTVKKVLAGAETWEYDITEEAEKVLKLRQWAARTSLRKHTTILNVADHEKGVVRFLYQFAGASRTQRWAGRKVQTQNLPRTPKDLEELESLTIATDLIRGGDYEALSLYCAEPLEALVGTVRSAFRTPDGFEFVVCDLASIESCVIGWVAKCERLLNVFRSGLDAYKDFATTLYGVPYDQVTKKQRTDSKPAVLGAGYRLGGGFLSEEGKKTGLWGYAENMGINLTQAEAVEAVRMFRAVYKEIPKLWYDLEEKVEACVVNGTPQRLGYLRFEMDGDFFKMILPSGRPIFYHKPQMRQLKWQDGTPRQRLSFTYMGQHQKTGQWRRLENHGGRFTEQAVQGIARDVLAEGLKRADDADFDIRGHVHDEIKTMRRIGANRHSIEELRGVMTAPIPWAPGLPLGAAGWQGDLYRKD